MQSHHEEAIEPVRPGFRTGARARTPVAPRSYVPLAVGATFIVLLLTAIAVFFVLPNWVPPPAEPAPQSAASPAGDAADAGPALTEEEIEALREEANDRLAELLSQQRQLRGLSADTWAAEDWPRYDTLARDGDDAFLAERFRVAVDLYGEALALGEDLLSRADRIKVDALAAARLALEGGHAATALEQFDTVLRLEPDHAEAEQGRRRAERLPEVLDLVRDAQRAVRDGRLDEAADAYRAALERDRRWAPARDGLADVERRLAEAAFERVMSRGYEALAEQRYADAEAVFDEALAMRPDAAGAVDGRQQAEQGAKLDRIELAQARALAFERRELWDRAIEQYEQALDIDATLTFARRGIERAATREALDAKLQNLIRNPGLLFRDDVLNDAQRLLEEAEIVHAAATDEPGSSVRLAEQIERLGDLVAAASRPVPVELVSDGLTEVMLYRVGPLGQFESTEVELRPGNYTAVGSRVGYRDVRQTFTVVPGRELPVITIVCTERI